ncbi:MAG: DUF1254 domain-containing protein [Rhizomicrobium sp.]|jgi:uncharacterized membrane protein
MSARGWMGWIAVTIVVAALVHVGSLYALPYLVMDRAFSILGDRNTMHHGARADANSHGIVRPSPDLLYSTCPYDLSKGPLEVRAVIPRDTYWSVSAFDDETNNWYVLDDRQAERGKLDLVVQSPDRDKEIAATAHRLVVNSPTRRGLILIRTLIADEDRFAAIDRTRRLATCGPFVPPE